MALPTPDGDRIRDDVTGAAPDPLREAADVMRAVRDRCVWTQQIDHRALVPYLVEESAELIDAVEDGSRDELREELGDLLWQVLFHSEIASRDPDDPFDIDDVARGLTDKMVRRHPHVFGDAVATTPEEVLVHWNAAKAAEKSTRTSVLDGVSERMPSLALAQKLLGKAAQAGVSSRSARSTTDSPRSLGDSAGSARSLGDSVGSARSLGDSAGSPRSLGDSAGSPRSLEDSTDSHRSLSEERSDETKRGEPASEAELGELLLALVATAKANGWDAERALRERLRGLERDIRAAEADPAS